MTQSDKELCTNQKILITLLPLGVLFPIFYFQQATYLKYVLSLAIGFYFAILVGHCLIKITSDTMWVAAAGHKEEPESHFNTSAVIGWIERTFYVLFLLLGKPEAIGFWLTLKTAGRFWTKNSRTFSGKNERLTNMPTTREIYQIFLINNALSIGYAIAGWLIVLWLEKNTGSIIFLLTIGILGNYCIVYKIKTYRNRITDVNEVFKNSKKSGYKG